MGKKAGAYPACSLPLLYYSYKRVKKFRLRKLRLDNPPSRVLKELDRFDYRCEGEGFFGDALRGSQENRRKEKK